MTLIVILASTFLVSILSLVGIFTLSVKERLLHKVLFCLVGFSAGALIGSAFLHLLPESLEGAKSTTVFSFLISGIVIFFMLERYFYWRHCHQEDCNIHPFTYLNLIGDGIHNFLDGVVIAVSFVASWKLGLVTTLAIIFHEIPQELGDFAVLVYGGLSRKKALFYNFISALTSVLGAIVGFFLLEAYSRCLAFLLPLTAGGFIYIAASDLIPQIHREKDLSKSNTAFLAFLLGIFFMGLVKFILPE